MISGIGVHYVSGVIGIIMMAGALTVWLSHIWPAWRRKAEHIFVKDGDLFAERAYYTGTVRFFRWWSFLPGALLVLPRFVLVDIVVVLAAVALWRFLVSRARQGFRETT